MRSKYDEAVTLTMTVLICLTIYMCVREMCRASMANTAIEKGITHVIKK